MEMIPLRGDLKLLKGLMIQRCLKGTELAANIGLSYSVVSKVLCGEIKASPLVRDRIERYFGREIFTRKKQRTQKTKNQEKKELNQ